MYRKISNTGLYITYNPGITIHSLQNFTRHKKSTNEYASCGNEQYSKLRTGTAVHTTVTFETFRQEWYYSFREPFSTVHTIGTPRNNYRQELYSKKVARTKLNNMAKTKGASLRREHHQAYRKPPPTRDKFSSYRVTQSESE